MVILDDLLEPACIDVSVDLCRADVGVAQEFLYNSQIGSACDQVRGKRVAERVRVHVFKAGSPCVTYDDLPHCRTCHRPACP